MKGVLTAFGAILLAGCNTTTVSVIERAKVPISGAEVTPATLSMNLPVQITDKSGIVVLRSPAQNVKYVIVKKEGFTPSGQVAVSEKGVTTVVLEPVEK